MKKIISFLLCTALVVTVFIFREDILSFIVTQIRDKEEIKLEYQNDYTRDYNFNYVQLTDNFKATSKEQLLNIYFTIINSGIDSFMFYCAEEYTNCINDVHDVANDQNTLSAINSFVHPFNSFNSIETVYDSLGKVTLKINKSYTQEQIDAVNKKIDEIVDEHFQNVTDTREIIKKAHDYIIDNAKYDTDKSDNNITKYHSSIAYGPLIEGYALCGGYTDAMAVILNRYNIPNIQVVSENHVWNAVQLDGKWYHLDLTWDDPISEDGRDILEYNYFIIETKQLEEYETSQHFYNKNIFVELAK